MAIRVQFGAAAAACANSGCSIRGLIEFDDRTGMATRGANIWQPIDDSSNTSSSVSVALFFSVEVRIFDEGCAQIGPQLRQTVDELQDFLDCDEVDHAAGGSVAAMTASASPKPSRNARIYTLTVGFDKVIRSRLI